MSLPICSNLTSCACKRNFAGQRKAWLRPLMNTRAVIVIPSPMSYACEILHQINELESTMEPNAPLMQHNRDLTLFQPVPHTTAAAVLLQMVALGQIAQMLFEGVAAGSGQFDGIHHRDAAMLPGEFHNLQ